MCSQNISGKIVKDSYNVKVDLESMSLEAEQAFIVMVKSLTNIIKLTLNNQNIKIQINQGSACVAAEGESVEVIAKELDEILKSQSTNKELVEQWRRVQTLFSNNGLHYGASITGSALNV